jgi:DNA polymerase III epsilon subunit-like protein
MSKRICFVYTETTGLHNTIKPVSKKELFAFARMVSLNYIIGSIKDMEFIEENRVRTIIKPRSMVIPEETIKYHGITQEYATKHGIDPEQVVKNFIKDIKNVDIMVSHNVDFHLKTILAEAVRYNIMIDLTNYIVIDTINFAHNEGFMKLRDLAVKLKVKDISDKNEDNVEIIGNVFFKLYSKYKKSIK